MATVADPRTFSSLQKALPHTYNFSQWDDGRAWTAVHGQDFNCRPFSFRCYLYNYAARIGKQCITHVSRGNETTPASVTFQFVEKSQSVSAAKAQRSDSSRMKQLGPTLNDASVVEILRTAANRLTELRHASALRGAPS